MPIPLEEAHEGRVFSLQRFFGDVADNGEIVVLVQVNGAYDMHILELAATVEGFWELQAFRDPEYTAVGDALTPIDVNMFTDGTADATLTYGPTLVNTTVDAVSASGQKVLNVTSTVGFVAGRFVRIDDGEVGVAKNEMAEIDTIQAGVSLTMVDNLENGYTNESVISIGQNIMDLHAEGGQKNQVSGANQATANWLFVSGQDYILRMINRADAAARATLKMQWLENTKQV
jgi:hypothetical protein